jgi:ADP-L-glycero-D-manno-heptose 6-epimerase
LTGSNGFIGKNFKKHIKDKAVLNVEQKDCFDFLDSFNSIDNIDLILHQGAISSTTETDIEYIYKYNVEFTLKLFKLAAERGIPVKYASSASIYGNNEDNTIGPLNQYAISKLQIDYWVKDNLDKFPLIQGFRYFNVYGDGEETKGDQSSPVSKFAKQIKETGRIKLFKGSNSMYRDFICVDDLVNLVLNNDKSSGIYDLGTSKPITFAEVAELVVNKYGGEIENVSFPEHLKNKYQYYTCAENIWKDYKFKTVKEYLS